MENTYVADEYENSFSLLENLGSKSASTESRNFISCPLAHGADMELLSPYRHPRKRRRRRTKRLAGGSEVEEPASARGSLDALVPGPGSLEHLD